MQPAWNIDCRRLEMLEEELRTAVETDLDAMRALQHIRDEAQAALDRVRQRLDATRARIRRIDRSVAA